MSDPMPDPMMGDILIKSGTVVTDADVVEADVLVRNGLIAEIGQIEPPEGTTVIDASGQWVGPGLVDIHTHTREPGYEYKEDIESASRSAAVGGYTAIVAMPNTDPATDRGHVASLVAARGEAVGLVEVQPSGAISVGRRGEVLAHVDELWQAGCRIFTDDGDPVADSGLMRSALEYIGGLGGVVSQHCEDKGLSHGNHMHEGTVSSLLGIGGIPNASEDVIVARDIHLSELTGRPVHFQHLSSARAVEMVADAKARGIEVSAEVTPHHLMFTDKEIEAGIDPVYKMHPPLRSETDRQALISGLRSGVIDVVATDHAPHVATDKDVPFQEAANGVIGLETAAAVVMTILQPDPQDFFTWLSVSPARIAQMADQGRPLAIGGPANLVVFDPAANWTPESYVSKSSNSPYTGRPLQGRVTHTISRGTLTVSEGVLQ